MTRTLIIKPDGTVLGLWYDDMEPRLMFNAVPVRATHVLPVLDGPNAGKFQCDLSPLAELIPGGSPVVCLRQTFARYDEAVQAEINYVEETLRRHAVLSPVRPESQSDNRA